MAQSDDLRQQASEAAAGDQERAAKLDNAADATATQETAGQAADEQRDADKTRQAELDSTKAETEAAAHRAQEAANS
jgi:hypothetical protein